MSLIGKRLGNYDIHSKIGEGGMGIVYMGVHPQIGKKVAVKVLHPELSDKADVVTRFFNEAKAVNDINHPNIVDIIDFGESTVDGVTFKYIMMEFLDGESLSARMRREGVTIRESVSILAQCCSALSASHAKGVVHLSLIHIFINAFVYALGALMVLCSGALWIPDRRMPKRTLRRAPTTPQAKR